MSALLSLLGILLFLVANSNVGGCRATKGADGSLICNPRTNADRYQHLLPYIRVLRKVPCDELNLCVENAELKEAAKLATQRYTQTRTLRLSYSTFDDILVW